MEYEALCNKLKEPAYLSLDNMQALAQIRAETVIVREPASCKDVTAFAIKNQFYANVEEGQLDSNAILRKLCKNILHWFEKMDTVDFDSLEGQQMLGGLITFKLITPDHAVGLSNLSNVSKLWVDVYGWSGIELGHIESARRMILEVK